MKTLIRGTAAVLAAVVLFALPVRAAPTLSARCAILMDGDTGEVLYAQNAGDRSLIASTTKIMTAVVVLEHCPLEMEYEIPPQATGIEGSSIYLQPGEILTVEELLYGMLLHSGNDAAVALALACSDDLWEFVDLMNLKAQKLGLKNTHFDNPNGLDSDTHYSTAYDLATLTRYALQNEDFVRIVSTKTKTIGSRCLTNHNKLLWMVEGAMGVKTGFTKAAGRILVSAAEQKGRRLIAVTIHDGNDWADHKALYDYGFSCYEETEVVKEGDVVGELSLLDGTAVPVSAGETVAYALRPEEKAEILVTYPATAFAPGEPGSFAGWGIVKIGERQIGRISLVWGNGREGKITENHIGSRHYLPAEGGGADR